MKYNEMRKCPKCGNYGVSARYSNFCSYESIQRRCLRCGYEYCEEPEPYGATSSWGSAEGRVEPIPK